MKKHMAAPVLTVVCMAVLAVALWATHVQAICARLHKCPAGYKQSGSCRPVYGKCDVTECWGHIVCTSSATTPTKVTIPCICQ